MSEEDCFQDESDDDSISLLFNNVNNLTLEDDTDIDNNASNTQTATHRQSQQQRKDNKRHKSRKAKKKHKQHSLEHLKQKVTHLMSIFEKNGWYIPLPNSHAESILETSIARGEREGIDPIITTNKVKKQSKKGKVWSNRNYGQDKKRQRKENERRMIEGRIIQLERVLRNEHNMLDL